MNEIRATFSISGPDLTQNQVIVTRDGLRVGRAATNDLVLAHDQISRQHMRFIWQDGAFWVEDLESSNGVWLNGERLAPSGLQRLKVGDMVVASPFSLKLENVSVPQPPPTAQEIAPQSPAPAPPVASTSESAPPSPSRPISIPKPIEERPPIPRPRLIEPPEVRTPLVQDDDLPVRIVPPTPDLIPGAPAKNGHPPPGIPIDQSNWLHYLPAIYAEDEFLGRYLLIFESLLSPILWLLDNFDMYLAPETAPPEWLQWMGSWFDVLILPELPVERQRAARQLLGWLFLRRGTRLGLERLLELYFGVKPEIEESQDVACHFTVRLPLRRIKSPLGREVAERLIIAQKPAFSGFALEIT